MIRHTVAWRVSRLSLLHSAGSRFTGNDHNASTHRTTSLIGIYLLGRQTCRLCISIDLQSKQFAAKNMLPHQYCKKTVLHTRGNDTDIATVEHLGRLWRKHTVHTVLLFFLGVCARILLYPSLADSFIKSSIQLLHLEFG